MARFDDRTMAIVRRLQAARIRMLQEHPFYALLLLQFKFSLDTACSTAYTDGVRIAFHPDFIDCMDDEELMFVLMHEVLHVALAHPFRGCPDYDHEIFNVACDIVVNSIILEELELESFSITNFGEVMHKIPHTNEEGYRFTAEEVYQMISPLLSEHQEDSSGKNSSNSGDGDGDGDGNGSDGDGSGGDGSGEGSNASGGGFDDHSFWKGKDNDMAREWMARMVNATECLSNTKNWGSVPACVQRMIDEYLQPQTDWRTVLENFIQEEITDYSFSPPDRRFDDSPFFLPDYNEKEESVKDILFMVDTSGSMSETELTEVLSEIKGGIDQFNGHLCGWLGFFDAAVVEPQPFESLEEFAIIQAEGGGGTSFHCIFEYVREHMKESPPASIVILTDGYAPFPDEADADGIPVLWLINNQERTPEWGKIARIQSRISTDL